MLSSAIIVKSKLATYHRILGKKAELDFYFNVGNKVLLRKDQMYIRDDMGMTNIMGYYNLYGTIVKCFDIYKKPKILKPNYY